MDAEQANAVEAALEAELQSEKAGTQRMIRGGGLGLVLWGTYLFWACSSIAQVFDEQGLAQAAGGYVVEQVPIISGELHERFVVHADDVVKEAAAAALAKVPAMRVELEGELFPAIDSAAAVLAESSVEALVAASKEPETLAAIEGGPQSIVDAALAQLPGALDGALDVPDEEGRTPRQAVADSLAALQEIDGGLSQIAAGKGDPMERELIVAWVDLLHEQGIVDLTPEDIDDRL